MINNPSSLSNIEKIIEISKSDNINEFETMYKTISYDIQKAILIYLKHVLTTSNINNWLKIISINNWLKIISNKDLFEKLLTNPFIIIQGTNKPRAVCLETYLKYNIPRIGSKCQKKNSNSKIIIWIEKGTLYVIKPIDLKPVDLTPLILDMKGKFQKIFIAKGEENYHEFMKLNNDNN